MRQFRKKAEQQEVPPFQFVELNALRLPTPQHAYSFLLEQLTGWHTTPNRAAEELNSMYFGDDGTEALGHFNKKAYKANRSNYHSKKSGGKNQQQKPVTILLVDEMDQLVTRSQSVLYNIFEWPMHRDSCLSVIGIANTIDLPERFLPRVLSRLGLQRVAFQPYSQQQIQCIIRSRLKDLEGCSGEALFDRQAIEYVARKVAAVSGDVRRALELCRRGAEMACEKNNNNNAAESSEEVTEKVTIRHIDSAIKEMFGASHMKLLEALPELDKIVLGFLIIELKKSGTIETSLEHLVTRTKQTLKMIPEKDALKDPQIAEISHSVTQLSRMKLVVAEPPVKHRQRKIALNIPADDVTYSIGSKGGEQLTWMHKLLRS
jgi:origin recognition complex subunit 1